jgi:hypothetical protein
MWLLLCLESIGGRLDVVKVIITLTLTVQSESQEGFRQMSKAQRKRNRKVRNLQLNWGRIDRERREQSEILKQYRRVSHG